MKHSFLSILLLLVCFHTVRIFAFERSSDARGKISSNVHRAEEDDKGFYSFEFFPPKSREGLSLLYAKMKEMKKWHPLFVDVTWGAGGSTSDTTLDACSYSQNVLGVDTQMHITCRGVPGDQIDNVLEAARQKHIRNIMALRGDFPRDGLNTQPGDPSYAIDLVRYIRQKYGDFFQISVAGYPEGHPESESYEQDLVYLKQKVDAGADMIITQLFFDINEFLKFKEDCRNLGITCPIIPGIMSILSYHSFMHMVKLCHVKVPQHILEDLEAIKDDDEKVKAYGIQLTIFMCNELHRHGINGLHLYTLNSPEHWDSVLRELEVQRSLSPNEQGDLVPLAMITPS